MVEHQWGTENPPPLCQIHRNDTEKKHAELTNRKARENPRARNGKWNQTGEWEVKPRNPKINPHWKKWVKESVECRKRDKKKFRQIVVNIRHII